MFSLADLSGLRAAYRVISAKVFDAANPPSAMASTKRKIAHPKAALQRLLPFNHEGEYFDLRAIFTRINAQYFRRTPLRNYTIEWGRRRKLAPREYFVFGTIQEEDRIIRIHPRLDAAFVPTWFLEYVIYHEMLHSVVPDEIGPTGRRKVHTEEFNRREREFYYYRRARRWEEENLARFLR